MRRRWILFIAVFVLGMVAGYSANGIQRAVQAHRLSAAKKTADPSVGVGKLNRKLHLSQKQKNQIARILDQRGHDINALKSEFRPRYVAIRESMKQEIQTVLDEQQKTRFQNMTEQAEKNYPWMLESQPAQPQQDDSSRPAQTGDSGTDAGSDDTKS